MHRLILLSALFASALFATVAAAQPQQVLFPGQTGEELRASLRAAYRPTSVSGDNDDLYSVIDRTNVGGEDGVLCVYTGFFVPFDCDPSCDPSQDVFNGGSGINQEHTWPNSLLGSVASDDLHNLFPTRVDVNGDRGNLSLDEIPDTQTTRWYRGATSTTTVPPLAERDEYSELRSGSAFEPREVHEGNAARALFYMHTVHQPQTNGAFPFGLDERRALYAWHLADPIDQAEYDRTFRVAPFQQDKPNPFILDSTLVRRAYPEVVPVSTEDDRPEATALWVTPNPFRETATLHLTLATPASVRVEVLDALGRRVTSLHKGALPAGTTTLRLDGAALAPGTYITRIEIGGARGARSQGQTLRLVRLP